MSASDRAVRDTFVELADTLVDEFDVIDFLEKLTNRTVELLDVTACGVMLTDQNGTMNLIAASTEQARLLELFQLQNVEGPCLDCFRNGTATGSADLSQADDRWPRFAPAARAAGFASVAAVPMRLREEVIGAMNLFSERPREPDPDTIDLGRALAEVATIGILHERAVRRREVLAEQLQGALDSRIVIEQAKGVLAERHKLSVSEAFNALHRYARSNNLKLVGAARAVVDGELMIPHPPRNRVAPR